MRIHVLFADATASVLVPCGDGKMTIMELITKAKVRFTKISTDKHIGDDNNMCVYLHLEDNRKIYIDHDDTVADVLENDEQVVVHHNSWIDTHHCERKDDYESEEPNMTGQDKATPQLFDLANKFVVALDISPCSCDHASGLGIKINQKRKNSSSSATGIYVTSISSDGAAAMDGRLQKNDQILSVNQCGLTGKSLKDATDVLRGAFRSAINNSKVQLVVARKNQFTFSGNTMAVLTENLEEEGEYAIQGTCLQNSDTPNHNSPTSGSMNSPPILQSPPNSPIANSHISLPSQEDQSTQYLRAPKTADYYWVHSIPRDASNWAKQTEVQFSPKDVPTLPTIHTVPMAYGIPLHSKPYKKRNKVQRRSSSFSTADCMAMDESKFVGPVRSTGATSLKSSKSLNNYDRPNFHKFKQKGSKKEKSSKDHANHQVLIRETPTLPEKTLRDKFKRFTQKRFPSLYYSKDTTPPATPHAPEDDILASFDSDHSQSKAKRRHS